MYIEFEKLNNMFIGAPKKRQGAFLDVLEDLLINYNTQNKSLALPEQHIFDKAIENSGMPNFLSSPTEFTLFEEGDTPEEKERIIKGLLGAVKVTQKILGGKGFGLFLYNKHNISRGIGFIKTIF